MSNATQLKAAIVRTEKSLEFIAGQLFSCAPNQFGKYPFEGAKDQLGLLFKMEQKYLTIHMRLYNILVPKNINVPAIWYNSNPSANLRIRENHLV